MSVKPVSEKELVAIKQEIQRLTANAIFVERMAGLLKNTTKSWQNNMVFALSVANLRVLAKCCE